MRNRDPERDRQILGRIEDDEGQRELVRDDAGVVTFSWFYIEFIYASWMEGSLSVFFDQFSKTLPDRAYRKFGWPYLSIGAAHQQCDFPLYVVHVGMEIRVTDEALMPNVVNETGFYCFQTALLIGDLDDDWRAPLGACLRQTESANLIRMLDDEMQ